MSDIKAIETEYRNYRFRSRLEARWAVFFDALGVKWEYEKEGYDLGEYGWYLPDFWLPEQELWIEVKGKEPTDEELLKLISLVEMTKHDGFIFGNIPESEKEYAWYDAYTNDAFRNQWSRSFKVADQLPLFARQNSYGFGINDYHIHCPVCQDEYVHFEAPDLQPSDDYKAWEGRGDAVRLPMWCEQGHSWTMRFGFHKGYTFMAIENVWAEVHNPGLVFAAGNVAIFLEATKAARAARFEHGEKPRVNGYAEAVA